MKFTGYTHIAAIQRSFDRSAYLAAEHSAMALHRSPDALTSVKAAPSGPARVYLIRREITGSRVAFRSFGIWPYAFGMENEEAHNTMHLNSPWDLIGNTSRDLIVGRSLVWESRTMLWTMTG